MPLVKRGGGGGGSFVIADDHFFADDAARDAFFTDAPEAGTLISVGTDYQQWDGSAWVDKTAIVRGPKGDTGAKGDDGDTGPAGPQGPKGDKGDTGATGAQGPAGETGAQGATGPEGPTGATGPQGEQGAQGVSVTLKGTKADEAAILAVVDPEAGDAWINAETGDLYFWNVTDSQWDNVGEIVGPAGPTGATGATGPQGPAGATGPEGPQGIQGLKGDTGDGVPPIAEGDAGKLVAVKGDESGYENVAAYALPTASADTLGGVKVGENLTIDEDGVLSAGTPYALPTASADTLGGVKVGANLSIADGVLSATGGLTEDQVRNLIIVWA